MRTIIWFNLPDCARIWIWTLQSSCSCMPGTPGPMWFSASSGGSCSIGFLASGTKTDTLYHCTIYKSSMSPKVKVKELRSLFAFQSFFVAFLKAGNHHLFPICLCWTGKFTLLSKCNSYSMKYRIYVPKMMCFFFLMIYLNMNQQILISYVVF